MKVYFPIAECSISYAKILQASAMKVYFQIAECSISYAKIHENADKAKKSCRFFEKYIPLYAFLVKKSSTFVPNLTFARSLSTG